MMLSRLFSPIFSLSLVQKRIPKKDKLLQICFDEMNTKKKCGWDKKFDMIIGPGKHLMGLMARSLCGKLKSLLFYGFDVKMTKKLLNQIIYLLESIMYKVLVVVCDQAGENQSLQNSLGVTEDENSFPNPYDISRFILWTFDFWHGVKNFR